jgi:hypothetical protein
MAFDRIGERSAVVAAFPLEGCIPGEYDASSFVAYINGGEVSLLRDECKGVSIGDVCVDVWLSAPVDSCGLLLSGDS